VDIPIAITWLQHTLRKVKLYQMKQENGLECVTQSFFKTSRNERLCDNCKTPFMEGALDFLSDEFVCPSCDNWTFSVKSPYYDNGKDN